MTGKIVKKGRNPEYINSFSSALLDGFYLKEDETVDDAFARAAEAFCFGDYGLAQRIYDAAWNGWFMFASPILSNAPVGSWTREVSSEDWKSSVEKQDVYLTDVFVGEKDRGLPISCFSLVAPDNINGQMDAMKELASLSVSGGGVGIHNLIRATSNKAPGPIPFEKVLDGEIGYFRQGKCYAPGTEVLTSNGWKLIETLTLKDCLATIDDDGLILWDHPSEIVAESHAGEMIQFYNENRGINLTVTPDHSMVIQRKSRVTGWGALEKIRADKLPSHNEARFIMSSSYNGPSDILTPMERLLIAHQADGHNCNEKNGKGFSGVEFHLSKDRKIERLKEILEDANIKYSFNENSSKFYLSIKHLNKTLDWISLEKTSPEKALAYLEEIAQWDSTESTNGLFVYSTTDKDSADKVQALGFLAGVSTRLNELPAKKANHKLRYTVYVSESPFFNLEKLERNYIEYDGLVYCAVVPTGRLVVRNNGVALVCGNTRRGACVFYMDVDHPDILEHIRFRIPTGGDSKRKSDNLTQFHNGVNITDEFIAAVLADDNFHLKCPHSGEIRETVSARQIWEEILETRALTGEPYIIMIDKANRALPQQQKDLGLKINGSNLCSEIFLPTSEERTFVCCLSSLNLEKYDEWVDTSLVADLVKYLDNVIQWFIEKAPDDLAKAKFSAFRERAIGIGTMGWHYYLQSKEIPFEGGGVGSPIQETHRIFSRINKQGIDASEKLAVERGESPDMVGSGRRNSHIFAIAPNSNNAVILETSPCIEPVAGNAYMHTTRAGSHLVKNPYLDKLLNEIADGKTGDADFDKIEWLEQQWKSIITNDGSVQHLNFLNIKEKELFKTAYEIDQHWVIEQADARQQYLCQGQSLNLFFPAGVDKTYYNSVHLKAATSPFVKGLYYSRTKTGISPAIVKEIEVKTLTDWTGDECVSCSG